MERCDGIAGRDQDAEVYGMLDRLRKLRQRRYRRAKRAGIAGDKVKRDDTIIVLETGKVAIDIPSPYDGTITEVRVQEFDPIDQGEVIALIEVV